MIILFFVLEHSMKKKIVGYKIVYKNLPIHINVYSSVMPDKFDNEFVENCLQDVISNKGLYEISI